MAKRITVEGNIFEAVLPGTLYKITGIGEALVNELFTYNALDNSSYQISLKARKKEHSTMPKDRKSFTEMDYDFFCNTQPANDEISLDKFNQLLLSNNFEIIDIREKDEIPLITEFVCKQIPLSTLIQNESMIQAQTVVIICQSGKRSREAILVLQSIFKDSKKIISLEGGIMAYKKAFYKNG